MYHDTILFESNPQVGILVWIYLYITSHLVLGLYLTLILKIPAMTQIFLSKIIISMSN